MAELAAHHGTGPIPLNQVAQAQGISLDYLEQIVPDLRTAGLLKSKRGARGGYELGCPPDEVTVGDIFRALDGDILPIQCVSKEGTKPCVREQSICAARTVWQTVHKRVLETLDNMVLTDL